MSRRWSISRKRIRWPLEAVALVALLLALAAVNARRACYVPEGYLLEGVPTYCDDTWVVAVVGVLAAAVIVGEVVAALMRRGNRRHREMLDALERRP